MWCQKVICYLKRQRYFSNHTATIYALCSGQGKCGVAVIRISGANAATAILKMTDFDNVPKPRVAVLKHLFDPITMEKLDKGLILWFPGPRSFTGEDCCEFQIHGGPAVISSILSALNKLQHFRPAEPGEFTKRAFFNGKLDLTEVEGLADLIHAETEMQRRQALLQMEGNLSKLYRKWRTMLLKNVAHVEAFIDFSEDENIEANILELANQELTQLKSEIEHHLADGRRGERLRIGIKTTIIGKPNAGKSSLFNAISQRPAAIVTPLPGTTRDVIQLHLNINGYPLILNDTAGLRDDASDIIEQEGISRAYSAINHSDLLLIVIDSTNLKSPTDLSNSMNFYNFLRDQLSALKLFNCNSSVIQSSPNVIFPNGMQECVVIFNKTDLLRKSQKLKLQHLIDVKNMCCTSCTTEDGLSLFIDVLTQKLKSLCGNPSEENPSLTQIRHRHHLTMCCKHLGMFLTVNQKLDLSAHELRISLNHLGKITGEVSSDEIIDVIFKDFCIVARNKLLSNMVFVEHKHSLEVPDYIIFNKNIVDADVKAQFLTDMKVFEDFITDGEEKSMCDELEPYMKRLRYEKSHWDGAIEGYREIERLSWNASNKKIIDKVKKIAFSSGTAPLKYVHALDLKAEGIIKPHVDSVKFCGSTIAGLSLLSDCIMRLRFNKEKSKYVDVLLKRKSLYVMKGCARYDYTHEILGNDESKFGIKNIKKIRRISVICRNKP